VQVARTISASFADRVAEHGRQMLQSEVAWRELSERPACYSLGDVVYFLKHFSKKQGFMRTIAVFGLMLISALLVLGCSSGPAAVDASPASSPVSDVHAGAARQLAVEHFIDGTVYEMKGEYAKAVLEFQDALRYEQSHGIYFALSKNYSYLRKHSLAIEAGKEAVRLAPDNLDYRRTLAEAMHRAFQPDAAADQYREILARDSSARDAWYGLARIEQSRKPLQALETYQTILERFGPDWNVYLQVADLHSRLGQHRESARALEQMTTMDPGNQALKKSLADAYARAEEYDLALKTFKELNELDPSNLEYVAEIAGIYLIQKNYDAATEQFEDILSRDSVAIEVKLRIGELYFSQLEDDSTLAPQARSVFTYIRDTHPEDWRAYWFLGAIGAITDDDSASIYNFRKVTELASWNADAWVYLSSVFLGSNNFEEMATVLESALKVLPDDFRVNFFLGVAYGRLGQDSDAIRVLRRACAIDPENVDALSQLALVYDGMGRYAESDSLYDIAIRIAPDNDLLLNNYGYSLAERGTRLDEALEMATKAVQAQPENPSYLDTLGWIYFQLGRYSEAERYVREAIEKGEENAIVYEHLGDIYFKLDQLDRAMENWNMALELDEGNTALREKIARGSL
jgi:tetratricopeptide (TPR) repeat protein